MNKHDLKDLKERCNEQSWEQGLHVPEKGKTFAGEVREETVAWSKDTYQLLKQAEQGKVKSYVQDIALAVLDCKETATSRETFIRLMNERGYGVDWQDSHKYITYTDLAREQPGEAVTAAMFQAMRDALAEQKQKPLSIDDVAAMVAGQIGQLTPMDEETADLFKQLAKKMMKGIE
ncbi:hypothetical protein CO471_09410 [Campylobacter jejuni]|nr:hypothetical protein [Campylobacter jejuni]EAI3366955.1 hypothetical protein [Campylobacter jejuni]EAJ0807444.1 hypothetical protein [Campylobacter jejuni]EAJ0807501.1 hypothetical protein [Campylobacter jejuni]EAJ0807508.1 hypothetical protein [Campylobacter jejuni]